jgi:hypothetical protein
MKLSTAGETNLRFEGSGRAEGMGQLGWAAARALQRRRQSHGECIPCVHSDLRKMRVVHCWLEKEREGDS